MLTMRALANISPSAVMIVLCTTTATKLTQNLIARLGYYRPSRESLCTEDVLAGADKTALLTKTSALRLHMTKQNVLLAGRTPSFSERLSSEIGRGGSSQVMCTPRAPADANPSSRDNACTCKFVTEVSQGNDPLPNLIVRLGHY